MLTQSEHIDQLATALADVQALIDGVLKESPNSVYGSRYAELSKVWEAFQRVGPDHGLSVVQLPGQFNAEARTMSMSVRLMHSSGQWLGGEMSMPLSRADAHAYGSACTYARRYSLAALVGICPHDDDGNAAAAKPTKQANPPKTQTPAKSPAPKTPSQGERGTTNQSIEERVSAVPHLGGLTALYDGLKGDIEAMDEVKRNEVLALFSKRKTELTKG